MNIWPDLKQPAYKSSSWTHDKFPSYFIFFKITLSCQDQTYNWSLPKKLCH
jgi:hypothetical protein